MYKQQHLVVKICMKTVKKVYYVFFFFLSFLISFSSSSLVVNAESVLCCARAWAGIFWSMCNVHSMQCHNVSLVKIIWPDVYELNWKRCAQYFTQLFGHSIKYIYIRPIFAIAHLPSEKEIISSPFVHLLKSVLANPKFYTWFYVNAVMFVANYSHTLITQHTQCFKSVTFQLSAHIWR